MLRWLTNRLSRAQAVVVERTCPYEHARNVAASPCMKGPFPFKSKGEFARLVRRRQYHKSQRESDQRFGYGIGVTHAQDDLFGGFLRREREAYRLPVQAAPVSTLEDLELAQGYYLPPKRDSPLEEAAVIY